MKSLLGYQDQQALNVQVVRSQEKIAEHGFVSLDNEVLVPRLDIVVVDHLLVFNVLLALLDDRVQYLVSHLPEMNDFVAVVLTIVAVLILHHFILILDHVLDHQ